MEIMNFLIKLSTTLGVILLTLLAPLILLVALLTKICQCFVCKPPKSVVGEVAVVTGAGRGLGRAIALELAAIGCHVAVVDIDIEGAEETVEKIRKISDVKAKAYKVNVTSFAEITELGANVLRDLGAVTILINNAGVLYLRNVLNPAPEDVQRMIDVNFSSHFWTKAVFLPTMKKLRKGHIVTISSVASLFPVAFNSSYSATKSGANGHMKALRLELAIEKQKDIHVTTVMPSFLDTNYEVSKLVQASKANRVYPLIKGKTAARRIVEGMLAGKREILLPSIVDVLYRLVVLLPVSWQEKLIQLSSSDMLLTFVDNADKK